MAVGLASINKTCWPRQERTKLVPQKLKVLYNHNFSTNSTDSQVPARIFLALSSAAPNFPLIGGVVMGTSLIIKGTTLRYYRNCYLW